MSDQLKRLKQSQRAKTNSLAKWRASRIHKMDLPSGLHIKLQDVTMTDLMMTGLLPSAILDLTTNAAQGGAQTVDLKEIASNAADFQQMLNLLVKLCLIEPKIGDVADETHITLDEMPSDDKLAIFNFVNREAEKVRPFREGEKQPVEAV